MQGQITVDSLAVLDWANGRGSTREVFSYPESESLTPRSPRWRLSVAELSAPSDFSHFPSLVRTFMPIGGDCLLLIDGELHEVSHGDLLVFSGDSDTSLAELSQPCRALNLISERTASQIATLRLAEPDDPELLRASVRIALTAGADLGLLDISYGGSFPAESGVSRWAFIHTVESGAPQR